MTTVTEKRSVQAALTRESPLILRWKAYFDERFPLWGYGILIVSFYSSNQFLAHTLTNPGEPMQYDLSSLMGSVTLLCLFFQLRVFDDHKDYAEDCRYYPNRVLQQGVVTLHELKVMGGIAIAMEFLLGALWSTASLVSVLFAFCFSLLMFKEFFAKDWLKRHFLVYASTHMLIIPLFAIVVFSFATRRYPWEAPGWFWLYSFVGFFVAFNWEVSRKIRAPEEEIEGVNSYTKIFGTYGAAYVVLLMRVIDTGLVALVGYHLQVSAWFYIALVGLFGVCMIGFFQYRFWTTPKTARRMATYAGMYIVAFDLTLAIELGRTYGVSFAGVT
ncbi:MAG: UbiA family prenyltransferase [Planctomycetes bacterium]|nr:UbiA family prenyltransferase [Planctomycetota bacterium]